MPKLRLAAQETKLQVEIKKDAKLCLRRNGINKTGPRTAKGSYRVCESISSLRYVVKLFIRNDDFHNCVSERPAQLATNKY